ncbi:MAG: hypothetical protein WBP31_02615 [Chitinophagales bacterium]|jgi:hypothetical protein|nr:hypothetical protein [Bacteroidota bacterium]MBK9554334.1 hypothetical protein [Bacteroidota bacterium]MBL0280059.1 hypothetical protein [Bacteroidota bacterium]MBP8248699.1 hypothetical protein [Chitinophagales bacterium]
MKCTLVLFSLTLLFFYACKKSEQDSSTEYQLQIANNNLQSVIDLKLSLLNKMAREETRLIEYMQPVNIVDSLIIDFIGTLKKAHSSYSYSSLMLFKRKLINIYSIPNYNRSALIDSNINNYLTLDTNFTTTQIINQLLNLELEMVSTKYREITYCGFEIVEQAIDIGNNKYICIIQNRINARDLAPKSFDAKVQQGTHFLPKTAYRIELQHHMFVLYLDLNNVTYNPTESITVNLSIERKDGPIDEYFRLFSFQPYFDKAAL